MTQVVITSGATWTVPSDCIAATVELIGAGQGGNATNGGNGGDYAKKAIASLTPGASVNIQLGVHGAGVASGPQNTGTDTWFSSAATVLAKGGGSASTSIGDATFAGGSGDASGGGGGAAGPNAAGGAASGSSGGQGDGTFGGLGGASGAAGAAGTEWGTVGSGGGGGTAAAASVTLVNVGSSANSSSSAINLSVPITVSAGDTILAVLSARQGATNTGPSGFTLLDDYIAVSSTSMSEVLVYSKTADGTETSVAATSTRSFNGAALQVWKVPGGATAQTFRGGRGAAGTSTSWSVGPFTPTNANATVIALWSGGTSITGGTYGVDAAWSAITIVDTDPGTNLGTASVGWATQQQTTATAATATFSASVGVNNPTDYMIAVS